MSDTVDLFDTCLIIFITKLVDYFTHVSSIRIGMEDFSPPSYLTLGVTFKRSQCVLGFFTFFSIHFSCSSIPFYVVPGSLVMNGVWNKLTWYNPSIKKQDSLKIVRSRQGTIFYTWNFLTVFLLKFGLHKLTQTFFLIA